MNRNCRKDHISLLVDEYFYHCFCKEVLGKKDGKADGSSEGIIDGSREGFTLGDKLGVFVGMPLG